MENNSRQYKVSPGFRSPCGFLKSQEGVNFSIYSRHAICAELLLYSDAQSSEPFQVIVLDPDINHTFFYWHVFVTGLPSGVHYTWRMQGPNEPREHGWRFDHLAELVDPCAKAVSSSQWNRWLRYEQGVKPHDSMRAVVLEEDFDWEGDQPIKMPAEDMVIYEMHVGGFTRHDSSQVGNPGTFSAVTEKIGYLKQLGITHIELMPIMAFDEQDVPKTVWDNGLVNYWGYSTHSFYSPHPGYCVDSDPLHHRNEFREMVKALHKAGIGVILDVVFNHTAEGGIGGPTINFKGLGNETFYILDEHDKSIYLNFTGCGNTFNANHPYVSNYIINCLEYWVSEMHVDGFRFDLASALARGVDGHPMEHPPMLWGTELSDTLANTKIIAEAWDAAGIYQVGSFPGYRWMEWNGLYRDTVRRFVRGDPGIIGQLATRITGSSDLYQGNLRLPINSINFVTCHDGYTLYDLVSYEQKNNWENAEDNRDGHDDNLSWNCGEEGKTIDQGILALRHRQVKNFISILLLSQGVPMLLAGDEALRSQSGNNNAWCQNNETSWFDWKLIDEHHGHVRFVTEMIALRNRHSSLRSRRFLSGQAKKKPIPDICWYGTNLEEPKWNDPLCRELSFTLARRDDHEEEIHVMFNMGDKQQTFYLPALESQSWYRAVDTNLESPLDIERPGRQLKISGNSYTLMPRSIVVLESR
jgi:isoamylase